MNPRALILLVVACLTLCACGGVDPNSPLGKRKSIFKQMLHTSDDMNSMLLGSVPFDSAQFLVSAVKLDELAQLPWQHFPKVREEDHTNAKPEVWERQARFQELAQALEASTARLVIASRAQTSDATALDAPLQDVEGRCKACHLEFRDH